MPAANSRGYAFNRTRQAHLATELSFAKSHWSRLRGLMGVSPGDFRSGQGLWIVPSHGVHTFAMRFPIDVVYLNGDKVVVYLKANLQPWRLAPVSLQAVSVLELPNNTLQSTGTAIGDHIEIGAGVRAEAQTA
jgi:uncharacterized protein